jgi:hypothetical protein
MTEAPIAISAEIISAAARWPPSSEHVEDADVQGDGLQRDHAVADAQRVAERNRGERHEREEDGDERRQAEERLVRPRGAEVFLREHLQRVRERVEEPERANAEDRRAIGPDTVLHDRRLLALDPAEDGRRVEHEHHHEGHAPEGDAEICDDAHAGTVSRIIAPPSPSVW